MSLLTLKLLRDLRAARWQFVAITLVASLGVAMFHGSMVSYQNQLQSYVLSYERLAFADAWIALRRAPRAVVPVVAAMDGVLAAEGRISEIVEIEQEAGRRTRAIGRILTVPSGREPRLNRYRLLEGAPLGSGSSREVHLEVSFARANGYRPGDRIALRFQGRKVPFRVAGIVSSPEFIYPVLSSGFIMPMPGIFGALFVREDQAAPLLGMSGQINEVMLRCRPGKESQVASAVRERLRAYGAETPMLQPEQPSNKLLQSDLEGNRPFLVVMPTLFLATAALAVGLMLARWVQAQRGIIGFLRASGFPARAVLLHFLGAGLLIGAAGGAIGLVFGHFLGVWFGTVYERLVFTPFSARGPRPEVALGAVGLSLLSCLAGAYGPARQAARISPAEAMRGLVPAQPRRLLRARVPLVLAIPLRSVLRRPLRSLGTSAGVASAVILMLIAGTFGDSIHETVWRGLEDYSRYELGVTFVPERSANIVRQMGGWPGVARAEPTLDIPVRAHYRGRQKETLLMGIAADSRLRVLRGEADRPVLPAPGEVLFGGGIAKHLPAERGDMLKLVYPQSVVGRSATAYVRSGKPLRQFLAQPLYMRMDDVRRLFAARLQMPPDAVNGAVLDVLPGYTAAVQARLHRTDGVALALTYEEIQRQVHEFTAFARTFILLMFALGAAMAFATTYTVTDIVIWERQRELATLRTLGMGMGRIALLVSLENLAVAAFGALMAVVPALTLARIMLDASSTEGYALQMVTQPATYALALGGTLVVVLLAQIPGLRGVRRMDLAAAVKLRD